MTIRELKEKCERMCEGNKDYYSYSIKKEKTDTGKSHTIVTFVSRDPSGYMIDRIIYNVTTNTIKFSHNPKLEFCIEVTSVFRDECEIYEVEVIGVDDTIPIITYYGLTVGYMFSDSLFVDVADNDSDRRGGVFITEIPPGHTVCEVMSMFMCCLEDRFTRAIILNNHNMPTIKYSELTTIKGCVK